MTPALSRTQLIHGLQCSRRLWWELREPNVPYVPDPLSPASLVHEAARAMFSDGVLVPNQESWELTLAHTQALLPTSRVLFRPAFAAQGHRVRPDILMRLPSGGYRLMRVKATTKLRPLHLQELAIERATLMAAGLHVPQAGVIRLNKRHRPERDEPLLIWVDRSERVSALQQELPASISALSLRLAEQAPPSEDTGRRCFWPRRCPYLERCGSPSPGRPARQDAANASLIQAANQAGALVVRPQLREALTHEHDSYFLDFEAVAPAIPRFDGCRPFCTLPVQFSLHRRGQDPANDTHSAYLHRESSDPRVALAAALVAAISTPGPIYVWGEFEAQVLRILAQANPTLRRPLKALGERIVDLQSLARRYAYHPEFRGSWSIKRVLPALVPGQDYSHLALSDGAQAVAAWMHMQHAQTEAARAEALAQELLDYCAMDTLALIHIRAALLGCTRLAVLI